MTPPLDLVSAYLIQTFILVDPLGCIPVFIAITPRDSARQRRRMAGRGCTVAAMILLFFLFCGPPVMRYFGIGTPAVRICSGLLLFVIALEMLYGKISRTVTSSREEHLAEVKEDVSITPLAIPLLAGPGAIANVLLFAQQARTAVDYGLLAGGTGLVFALTFALLVQSGWIARHLGGLGIVICTRIMGLILAFLSAQYVLDGLHTSFPSSG